MAQATVYEGIPEQFVEQLNKLPNTRKYKITVAPEESEVTPKLSRMITFGMFPQLQSLTQEDFKNAEWQGEEIDI